MCGRVLSFKSVDDVKTGREEVELFLNQYLDEYSAFLMFVGVNEAINNSVIHGKSTLIKLKMITLKDKIMIKIYDNGLKYDGNKDIEEIKKSKIDLFKKNLYKENNRGLLIIEEACDDVIYNFKLNELILIKNK